MATDLGRDDRVARRVTLTPCDGDALLVKVDQNDVACHTGDRTCFDAGALELTGP